MLLQDYNCTWAILYAMYAGCGGWRWQWSRGSSLHSKVTHCEFLSLLFRKKWKYKENVQKKNEVNLQILFGAFSWAWLGDLEYLEDLWLQWWLTSLQLLDYMYKRKVQNCKLYICEILKSKSRTIQKALFAKINENRMCIIIIKIQVSSLYLGLHFSGPQTCDVVSEICWSHSGAKCAKMPEKNYPRFLP